MDTMEIEAQESEALLEEPAPSSRVGGVRVMGVLGAGALVAVGAKSMLGHSTKASTEGIVQMPMVPSDVCSHNGWDCRETKCCMDPNSKCFSQNEHWASCNATCAGNSKWDHGTNQWTTSDKDEDKWDCTELKTDGDTAPAPSVAAPAPSPAAVQCAKAGESCADSKCCEDSYHKCFQKHEHWATCNSTCNANMEWEHGKGWVERDHKVWDCNELKPDAGGDEGLAQDQCVKAGENCMLSKCCSQEGHTCYKKDEHWASCNLTCSNNMKWGNDGWFDNGEKVWECDELKHDDKDSQTAFCDMSGCQGCSGTQCLSCEEATERDCCLRDLCDKLSGDKKTECRNENLATCCEGKSGRCSSISNSTDSPKACDISGCQGCSGTQCLSCQEEKERDCCLDEKCYGCSGQQCSACRKDHVEKCCEGKSGGCSSGIAPAPTPPTDSPKTCDTSGCQGCSGTQCLSCQEEKERDCCLDEKCKGCGGHQCTACRKDHVDKCCEGKAESCKSL